MRDGKKRGRKGRKAMQEETIDYNAVTSEFEEHLVKDFAIPVAAIKALIGVISRLRN